jgi:hypothetical protein
MKKLNNATLRIIFSVFVLVLSERSLSNKKGSILLVLVI